MMPRSPLRTTTLILTVTAIFRVYRWNLVNNNYNAQYDEFLEGGPPRFREPEHSWDKTTSCFHLDYICHGNDEWFYRRSDIQSSRQPTITYVQNNVTSTHGYIHVDRRIYFNVSSSSITNPDEDVCPMSQTKFHMVIQSAFNDMMGEFYSRSLLDVNQLIRDNPIYIADSDLQMYVHFVEKNKQVLLEGHRLFLQGLPNNHVYDSFLGLLSNESCQCFKKLIFCGYVVEDTLTDSKSDIDSDEFQQDDSILLEDDANDAKVFRPDSHIKSVKTACTRLAGGFDLKSKPCPSYQELRDDVYGTHSRRDSKLAEKILQYRTDILTQTGSMASTNISTAEVNRWTFVGLTRRKKRRKWLNIDDAISLCDEEMREYKVVCVTIDVEDAGTPEEQLLMHRSLHVLIGVHGAQLTQGVLLPPHGHILELLPWVPDYLQGGWVQWTHRPTPLGVIYHKTDLNHLGYKLDRRSVPLCHGVNQSYEELKTCFMNNSTKPKFRWDVRDFNVSPVVIGNFLSQIVMRKSSLCEDMKVYAAENDFVLFNAYCREDDIDEIFVTKHYYSKF